MLSVRSYRAGLLALTVSLSGVAYAQEAAKPTAPPPTPPVSARPPMPKPAPKPKVKLPANIVARVGKQDLTREDLLAMVELTHGRGVIDQLALVSLLQQEAQAQGVVVTEPELQAGIQDAKDRVVQRSMQVNGAPRTFKEIAADEGFSEDFVRWSVYMDILRRKTFAKSMETKIPSLDNQVRLAHILVATVPLPSPDEQAKPLTPEETKKKEEDAKTKIDGVLADIKAGKITFEAAAEKYSDDKSNSPKGGDLGFLPQGQLDPEFEKAGFGIKNVGDIVGPVKSSFGYHLIKLIGRGKDATAAEKAAYRQRMVASMINNQQAMQGWVESLRQARPIIINPTAVIVPGAKSLVPAKLPGGVAAPAPAKKASKK